MKSGERHYLTCYDPGCHLAQCVGRIEFKKEISHLKNEVARLQNLLDKARLMVDQAEKRAQPKRGTGEGE